MNAKEAQDLRIKFLELKNLVEHRIPKKVTVAHAWKEGETMTYELMSINLENLTASYHKYIGCGDYEYHNEDIDLETIFKGEPA